MSHAEIDREGLIALCERGIVPERFWCDRDSQNAQVSLGKAWALLKAGCAYGFSESPKSDRNNWWIRINSQGFSYFEWSGMDDNDDKYLEDDLFYIPTASRLDHANGRDWY